MRGEQRIKFSTQSGGDIQQQIIRVLKQCPTASAHLLFLMQCSWILWKFLKCAWSEHHWEISVAACRPPSPTGPGCQCWGRRAHTARGSAPAARSHSCWHLTPAGGRQQLKDTSHVQLMRQHKYYAWVHFSTNKWGVREKFIYIYLFIYLPVFNLHYWHWL